MPIWPPDQVAALREVAAHFTGIDVVLVGAGAVNCQLPMDWRRTNDLDLTLAASIADCERILRTELNWDRHPKKEHEWYAPGAVKVDVLPAGLTGFRLAFQRAQDVHVADELRCRVAPLTVLTVLKMTSYLDRPQGRERDLADIGHIIEGYLEVEDWPDEAFELGMEDMGDTSSALLGRRIGGLVDDEERAIVQEFLERASSANDRTQARLTTVGPASWLGDPAVTVRRLQAFAAGLGAH